MIKRFNKKGFTLVEIIVVLVILAILAAIAVPSVLGYVEEAKKEKYIAEAKAIFTVIQVEETKLDKSKFNTVGEGIVSQKTGIPKVSNIHSDSKIYILNWTSEDGKIIDAQITKNKKVDILSVSQ